MSDLIAVMHDTREKAEAARQEILAHQRDFVFEIDDIVVAEKTEAGKVKLHQVVNLVGPGALQGGFLGTLVGLIFLQPLFGLAVGAGLGALSGALTDFGIDDGYMKRLADHLEEGRAILFVLLHKPLTDRAMELLGSQGGTVISTSLASTDEDRLRSRYDEVCASMRK